jgi:hypothetical protein
MNTFVYLCLPEFFLEWRTIQTKAVEENRTHILGSITFSQKVCCALGNVEKYGRPRNATDGIKNGAFALHAG